MSIIRSVEELKAIYGEPGEAALIKVRPALTQQYRQMIEASPFVALATVGPEGLDCSPRGDAGPVVRVADEKTLQLPDWRGNNRIDSLVNIVRDPRVALMFLIPGTNNVLRVNGRAVLSMEPALLAGFEVDGRNPRTVAVITIDEVYFQCARAVMRAGLWNPERIDKTPVMPSAGEMLKGAKADFDAASYDREWPERAAKSMW